MATRQHLAFLRGINVGGKNRLAMAELARMFEDAGCDRVRTYIQSGNVVFRADSATAQRIAGTVSDRLENALDLRVPVVTRSADEFRKIVRAHPFANESSKPRQLQVGFLADRPTAAAVRSLDPDRSPPDRFRVSGREIYLSFPNGVAGSKLTNHYFDRALNSTCTIRNWNTLENLLKLLTEPGPSQDLEIEGPEGRRATQKPDISKKTAAREPRVQRTNRPR